MSVLALARLALIELWRHKLALLPIGLAALMALLFFLPRGQVALVPADAFTWDLGVTIVPFFGAFVAVLAGGGMLAGEAERGTALLLATKPVSRAGIVAGKALGALAFVAASFAAWAAVLAAVSAARFPAAVAAGVGLGTMAGALPAFLYGAIAIAASARLPATGAIAAGGLAWFMATIAGGVIKLEEVADMKAVVGAARLLRLLVPAEQLGAWPALIAAGGSPSAAQLIALVAIPAWLGVAALLFSTRDLG